MERWHARRISWTLVGLGGLAIGVTAALNPTQARAVFCAPVVAWAICEALLRVARRGRDGERLARRLQWAMALRVVFAVVHIAVAIWIQGRQDLVGYFEAGDLILEHLAAGTLSSEVILIDAGDGKVSTAATAIGVALVGLAAGHTMWSLFLVASALSTVGAYLFLRACQRAFPDGADDQFLTKALLFLPAVGFWSTFVGKDFICFLALGWATYAIAGLLRRRNVADALGLVASTAMLAGPRAPVALALVLAAGAAFVVNRVRPALLDRAVTVLVMVVLIWSGTVASWIGIGVRDLTLETLSEQMAQIHGGYARSEGATTLPLEIDEPTPGAVLRFLPKGIFTLLFRPYLWEAHNILALAAGAENLVIAALVLWRWRALLRSVRAMAREPFLVYVLVAFLAAGAVLSMAWNLGTMARLRTMVMPYMLILLAGPGGPSRTGATVPDPGLTARGTVLS